MSFLGRALWHLCEMRQSAKTANRLAAVPSIAEAQSIGPAGADKRVVIAKVVRVVMSVFGQKQT